MHILYADPPTSPIHHTHIPQISPKHSSSTSFFLRNISIPPILLPLHIILLNQPVDVPLDVRHPEHAPAHRRLDDLAHELRVPDRLPALHDAHNRRLGLEVAVLGDTHVRLLVLLLGLFELHLVDFDAVLRVREVWVEGEGVGRGDVFALWMFGQRAQAGAGEGLKGAFDFGFGWEWGC